MSWRPEGWRVYISFEELTIEEPSLLSMMTKREIESYEAGADAMLEALRENQWCPYDYTVLNANFKGKIVIIPDDEVKDETPENRNPSES